MTGTKIDGLEVAKNVKEKVSETVKQLSSQGIKPCLATILVGDNPASQTYVRNKHRACEEVGIITQDHKPAEDITQEKLNELIDSLNEDSMVHGILLQLPLPSGLNEFEATSRILPEKDVDGLTPHNVGLLSNLVGKPLYHLLLQKNATVVTCHSRTHNLKEICKNSDIVITGVGNRDKFTLTSDMIKENAIVIDVATTHHDGKLKGDSDFDEIISKASYASPVPGGVGPMTVAMLLKNTITAAALSKGIDIKS